VTDYLLRTDLDARLDEPNDVRVLGWAPGNPAATVQTGETGLEFFAGWRPPRPAADLLLLGTGVYCADKTAPRRGEPDGWTRRLRLRLPVADPGAWAAAGWDAALRFLTGDRWRVEAYPSDRHPLAGIRGVPAARTGLDVDGVCLFSGGLDSLCGAIDLLEDDPDRRLCLLSHHEGGQASTAQLRLLDRLADYYGPDRIVSRRLYLRPAPANRWQVRPLPPARENTTRSRSLVFVAAAQAVAAATAPDTPVYVPENGFIGVNVPLTRARAGSLSTRTTHPHFMHLLSQATTTIGVDNPVVNPYRLQTKGEILAESRNPGLLRKLAPLSISCAHPETARYVRRRQGNCGYCFPCLVRRSALAHAGWDNGPYAWDVLSEGGLLNRRARRGADLRAVVAGAFADCPDRDVLRNGPLPDGEREAFLGVWRRGLAEIRAWLTTGAKGELADLVESLS
jgi:7-cyano-7-deazaguanine synthase in queuosine biosynthesis